MNKETFRLLRTAMGLEIETVAAELEINRRTVERWESGRNLLPEFAQVWLEGRWQTFLDELGEYVAPLEEAPDGASVTLAVYDSPETLRRTGSDKTLSEVDAMNRALAVCMGLADLEPVASLVPTEE
ncbi:helix-turn-helix transcriptional regulator [Trueperella pecoris]|uniref:Helix-turn-helix transcriptional regulator n=1 Tax=Trueperella pecoris TaxID=2733571 RepID=A0A7M1R060_9ACTO|nr:helix-turn-helix transcriptional regulator [Trueperella pecoris]QOR47568.1 helix-turn-helix transcriptional regulator [Trueperella pecoris]